MRALVLLAWLALGSGGWGAASPLGPREAAAHTPDTSAAARRSPAPGADRAAAPDTISVPSPSPASAAAAREPAPHEFPPLIEALGDHLHNKLVHFPIVLTLVAAVVLLVARSRPQLEPLAFWLVWATALSVIPATFSGLAQEQGFEGKPKEWLVELHEKQGIAIGIGQALWVLSLLRASTRRFAWVIGIVLAALVLGAGFLGGLVAHGH